MRVTQLYDEIYRAITNSNEIMALMGLSDATALDKAKSVQKRRNPQDLDNNMPLLTFYSPGGSKDRRNDAVYGAGFVFDIYTRDDVELAQDIGEALCELFDGQIPSFSGLTTFEVGFDNQFESIPDRPNTYCFTTVLVFYIGKD